MFAMMCFDTHTRLRPSPADLLSPIPRIVCSMHSFANEVFDPNLTTFVLTSSNLD